MNDPRHNKWMGLNLNAHLLCVGDKVVTKLNPEESDVVRTITRIQPGCGSGLEIFVEPKITQPNKHLFPESFVIEGADSYWFWPVPVNTGIDMQPVTNNDKSIITDMKIDTTDASEGAIVIDRSDEANGASEINIWDQIEKINDERYGKKKWHCDDIIDFPEENVYPQCAIDFLRTAREPAHGAEVIAELIAQHKKPPELYANYKDPKTLKTIRVRVTMASRFGDVGITQRINGNDIYSYQNRVYIPDLTDFSDKPFHQVTNPPTQADLAKIGAAQNKARKAMMAAFKESERNIANGKPPVVMFDSSTSKVYF